MAEQDKKRKTDDGMPVTRGQATLNALAAGEAGARRKTIADFATPQLTEEVKAKLFDPDPYVSESALVEIFNLFDADESGALENSELSEILTMCGINVSSSVLEAVLVEIDKDQSGFIDCDEFVEFFREMQGVDQLSKVVEKAGAKAATTSVIAGVYMFLTLIAIFVMMVVNENSNDPALRVGLYLAVAAFAFGMIYFIFLPIFVMKFRPAEKLQMLLEWHKIRKEERRIAKKPPTVVEAEPEKKLEIPEGSHGSYRNRESDPTTGPRSRTPTLDSSNLRALADAGSSKGGSRELALAIPDARNSSKQSKASPSRKGSKQSSEPAPIPHHPNVPQFQTFEDDPNEIKPLYGPDQYLGYHELLAREAEGKLEERAADAADMIEGGIYSHYRAMPSTHVSSLHNKAKLPQPVWAPWGDQKRFKKPSKK